MGDRKFSALLAVIVPPVVGLIAERKGVSEIVAAEMLYRSRLYQRLADEMTKFWHYGAETLYSMFDDEVSGNTVEYPEEAS